MQLKWKHTDAKGRCITGQAPGVGVLTGAWAGIKEHLTSTLEGNLHLVVPQNLLAVSLCHGLTVQAWRAQGTLHQYCPNTVNKSLLTFSVEWQQLCMGQDKLYRPEQQPRLLNTICFPWLSCCPACRAGALNTRTVPSHTNTSTLHVLKQELHSELVSKQGNKVVMQSLICLLENKWLLRHHKSWWAEFCRGRILVWRMRFWKRN